MPAHKPLAQIWLWQSIASAHAVPFAWVPGIVWLLLKTFFFMFVFLWLRATFPRYRYDQIMRLGWKVFIPITIVWLVLEGAAVVLDIGPWFD